VKDKQNLKPPPLTFCQRRLAGGGFSSLHFLREKTTLCPFVEIVSLENLSYLLGEIRFLTTIMNHCPDP